MVQERSKEGCSCVQQGSANCGPQDKYSLLPAVHGVAKSRARLSDFTFTFDFHALEKEMATKMKTAEIVTVICTFSQHKMCFVKESNPYRILNLEWTIPTIN